MTKTPFFSNRPSDEELPNTLFLEMGFLLNKAAQKIKDAGDEALVPFGITTQHLGIMLFLDEFNAASQVEISKALLIDRTTMVKMIDELENVGYVKREKDPQDRRRHKVLTTSNGKKQLPIFSTMMKEVEESFLSPLSEARRIQLVDDLQKLIMK